VALLKLCTEHVGSSSSEKSCTRGSPQQFWLVRWTYDFTGYKSRSGFN